MSDRGGLSIDECLEEFDHRLAMGQSPVAADFYHLLAEDEQDDFVDLIYYEFCSLERAGLKAEPEDFLKRYGAWKSRLERLLALHTSLQSESEGGQASHLPGVGDMVGPFLLTEVIGRGAAAIVFKAMQTDLGNRAVVLKVSTERISGGALYQARVSHPHIMPVYRQFRTEDGQLDITIMPFLEGVSLDRFLQWIRNPELDSVIRAHRAVDFSKFWKYAGINYNSDTNSNQINDFSYSMLVARWGADLADALFEGYQAGVIHADIKPANIFLDTSGNVYLLDFHLAKTWQYQRYRRVVRQKENGGTIFYMPPDRLEALLCHASQLRLNPTGTEKDVTVDAVQQHRADLYGLGLILLELMTRSAPTNEGQNQRAGAWQEEAAALIRLRKDENWLVAWPDYHQLSSRWRELMRAMLSPELAERPIDGRDVVERLQRIAKVEPRPLTPLERWRSKRLKIISILIITFFITFSAGAIVRARHQSAELARKLFAVSDPLITDPSETRETSLSVRLNQSRKILEEETNRHGWLWQDSLWNWVMSGKQARSDARFWFCARVERISRELQKRSEQSKSKKDLTAALLFLKKGLAVAALDQWQNEANVILEKLENGESIRTRTDNLPEMEELENYISAVRLEKEELRSSIEILENLSRQNPGRFLYHFELGRLFALAENHQPAIEQLQLAEKLNASHFETQRLLALEFFKNRDFRTSESLNNRVLRMRPDDLSSMRLSVILKIYFGQRNELNGEIERLEEIVLYDRGNRVNNEIEDGNIYTQQSENDVFNLNTINTLLNYIPEDPDLLKLKAKRLYLDNRHLESRLILESLQKKTDLSTFDMVNLATLYQRENANRKAADVMRRVIQRPDFQRWHLNNANVRFLCSTAGEYFEKNEIKVTKEYYEKLIQVNESNKNDLGRYYFYLARCLIREDAARNVNQATHLLLKAGFEQTRYVYRWYLDEPVFDPVRKQMDPLIQATFPELSAESQKEPAESEKKQGGK